LEPDIKNRNVFGGIHDTQTNQQNRKQGNGISAMHGKAARGAETEAAAEEMKAGTEQKRTKAMKVLLAQDFEPRALHLHFWRRTRNLEERSRGKGVTQELDFEDAAPF